MFSFQRKLLQNKMSKFHQVSPHTHTTRTQTNLTLFRLSSYPHLLPQCPPLHRFISIQCFFTFTEILLNFQFHEFVFSTVFFFCKNSSVFWHFVFILISLLVLLLLIFKFLFSIVSVFCNSFSSTISGVPQSIVNDWTQFSTLHSLSHSHTYSQLSRIFTYRWLTFALFIFGLFFLYPGEDVVCSKPCLSSSGRLYDQIYLYTYKWWTTHRAALSFALPWLM